MDAVTDMDREAAEELRVLLAGMSGFWHKPGDAGPLCVALARHRQACEERLLEKISRLPVNSAAPATADPSTPERSVAPPTKIKPPRFRQVA